MRSARKGGPKASAERNDTSSGPNGDGASLDTEGQQAEVDRAEVDHVAGDRVAALDLPAYRLAVDELYARLPHRDAATTPDLATFVGELLADPGLSGFLARLPGGVAQVHRELMAEVRGNRHGYPSSADDVNAVVRIFLLSQIDTAWWGQAEPYADAAAVATDADLVDLPECQRAGHLEFRFRLEPRGLPGRARNWVVRRYLPRWQPHTSGLSSRRIRPEMVALLKLIALDFAAVAPAGAPPLWVTSALRPVDQQHHLRALGYSALLPSAHCVGFAADVAVSWLRQFGADGVLAEVLVDFQDRRIVSVIDEGPSWHVCLNPASRADMRRQFDNTRERS